MTAFAIKLIATASMLIDHAGYIMLLSGDVTGAAYELMRALGRPAFVLFSFLLVNGYAHTRDSRAYLTRLIMLAVISQGAFTLAFSAGNYSAALSPSAELSLVSLPTWNYCALIAVMLLCALSAPRDRRGRMLIWLGAALILPCIRLKAFSLTLIAEDLNVFYTLAIGLALIAGLDGLIRIKGAREAAGLLAAVIAALTLQGRADYGYAGLALILALYAVRESRPAQICAAGLWCVLEYYVGLHSTKYALAALSALVPMALYSGRRGARMRGFYAVYPVHLIIFSLYNILISR